MKQKLLLIAASLFLFAFQLTAQKSGKITGQVKNEAGNPIKSATVMLHRASDSSMVKTGVTDASGNFEIEGIKAGQYFVAISFVGAKKGYSKSFAVTDGQTTAITPVKLSAAEKSMTGVTVTGSYKKPLIEVKADKTVFNVESSINATGSNAFELLQKSPGVVTDKDDNIIMKGKNGVKVYIDGRPTQLTSADLAAYLKSINSVDIESIETITNPSAKYDAEGNAGIINIKLKKNKKFGTNGTLTSGLNIGKRPKTNLGLSLNNRSKKVNLFSNYSNNWSDNINNFYFYRVQNGSVFDQTNELVSRGWSHNVKAGADIFLSKEHTIGFIATYNSNNSTPITNTRTVISNNITKKVDSILYSSNNLPTKTKNLNLNFNYHFTDSIGNDFELNFDHGTYRGRKSSFQPNSTYLPYPETFLAEEDYRNITPTNININSAKFDYEHPYKKSKLGVGAKMSGVTTDNTFDFYNVIAGNDYLDLNKSNSFEYKETITAAYVNYNHSLNQKWNFQAGVRMENTSSTGLLTRADGQVQADNKVVRSYTDFFPSAAITFNQSADHILNLTYSRRIDRPNYQDLNPFEFRLNKFTYQKGNPFLRPQYTNSISLTHTFKYRFNTSLSYSHIADFRAQWIDTLDGSKSFLTQKNLASQNIWNINFSLPFQIAKWWSLYANINAYSSKYHAQLGDDQKVNITVNSGNLYGQNSFTLKDGFSAEVSGFVTAPSVWGGTIKSRAMGGMDIGFQKQIFNQKGNVKISFTDVFHTMRWYGTSDYNGSSFTGHGRWEAQQVRLNLTYRFGNNQVKAARQRKTASEEESQRLNSSGGLGN